MCGSLVAVTKNSSGIHLWWRCDSGWRISSHFGQHQYLNMIVVVFFIWLGRAAGVDPGVASTILDQALNVQVTYGAVMLSFLGKL